MSFYTTVGVVLLKYKLELVDPNSAKSLASVDLHQSRDWQWLHKVSTSDSIAKGESYRQARVAAAKEAVSFRAASESFAPVRRLGGAHLRAATGGVQDPAVGEVCGSGVCGVGPHHASRALHAVIARSRRRRGNLSSAQS